MKLIDKIRVVLDKYNGGRSNKYAEGFIDRISGVDLGKHEETITQFKGYCLDTLIGICIRQNNPNLFGLIKKGQPVMYNNEYWIVENITKECVDLYQIDLSTNKHCDCYVHGEDIALIKLVEKNIQDNPKDSYLKITEHCPH